MVSRITVNLATVGEAPSESERRIIEALGRCSFLPASFDRRFARDMLWQLQNVAKPVLSPKQRETLWKLAKKFRRQMSVEINRLVEAGPQATAPAGTQ